MQVPLRTTCHSIYSHLHHCFQLQNIKKLFDKPALLTTYHIDNWKSFDSKRCVSTTTPRFIFMNKYRRGEKHHNRVMRIIEGMSNYEFSKLLWDTFKQECKLWGREQLERFSFENYHPDHMEKLLMWKFNNEETINQWICTADSDWNEGYSTASFTLSKNGHGLFSGYLDTRLPLDGKIKRTGYCNITCWKKRRSFNRENFFRWEWATHLIFRVRGDGRHYNIILNTSRDLIDLSWGEHYGYRLYTRGGPYWQYVSIPFSNFALLYHGAFQDEQVPIYKEQISSIGITLADRMPGPFHLEIDYIGALHDQYYENKFRYEGYYVKEYRLRDVS